MKKIFIFLLSTLISSTFYACNIPVNQNNSNVKQKQEQNEPKIDIEKLKKDFPIKAFSTKALNGNNNISFNTEGLNYKFNTSAFLHAYGFEKDRVYNIYLKSNSNETIYMFMWKKINGVWIPARWVKNSDNISFRGGAIDFSEILLWPACSINPASGNISIKQEDSSNQKIRSADPYSRYLSYDSGISVNELKGGNASHNLSPAQIIYYSARENNINPVLLLAKLQDEQSLITQGKSYGDFERRLLRAMGYGALDSGDINKWYGFYPQVVSTSLKFSTLRNGSFKTAYEIFTTGAGKYDNFISSLYPKYASKMNEISKKSYSSYPSSLGYFNDFRDISYSNIQVFLESYSGSLKEQDLFRQVPVNDSVAY